MNWKSLALWLLCRLPRILGGLGVFLFGVGLLGLFAAPPGRYAASAWVVQLILLVLSGWLLAKGRPLRLPNVTSTKTPPPQAWPEEAPASRTAAATALCPNCGAPGQRPGTYCEYCGSPPEP